MSRSGDFQASVNTPALHELLRYVRSPGDRDSGCPPPPDEDADDAGVVGAKTGAAAVGVGEGFGCRAGGLFSCFSTESSILRLKFALNTLPVSPGSRRRSWSRRMAAGARSSARSRRGCRLQGPARSCGRRGGSSDRSRSRTTARRVTPARCRAGALRTGRARFRAAGSSKPLGLRPGRSAGLVPPPMRRRQWACMRRSCDAFVRRAEVRHAAIACLRIAFRVAVCHCSHSSGALRLVVGVQ